MSKLHSINKILVEKHKLTNPEAELFLKEIFAVIREKLITDNLVKVKGLGSFKLTEVNGRASVDVNTGERIHIEGHSKITFTPENAVRDRINAPFSQFESFELEEGVDFDKIDVKYFGNSNMETQDSSDGQNDSIEEDSDETPSAEPPGDLVEDKVAEIKSALDGIVAEEAITEDVADEKSVADDVVSEEPSVEELVSEETVVENTITEEPTIVDSVVEESMEEPLITESEDENRTEEQIAEQPIQEETHPSENVVEEPETEEPVVENTVEETVAEEPAIAETLQEKVAAVESTISEAVQEEIVAEEPIIVEPEYEVVPEVPVVAEQPEVEASVGMKPVPAYHPAYEELQKNTSETMEEEPAQDELKEELRRTNSLVRLLLVVCAILIVCLIAFAAYVFLSHKNASSITNDQQQPTEIIDTTDNSTTITAESAEQTDNETTEKEEKEKEEKLDPHDYKISGIEKVIVLERDMSVKDICKDNGGDFMREFIREANGGKKRFEKGDTINIPSVEKKH